VKKRGMSSQSAAGSRKRSTASSTGNHTSASSLDLSSDSEQPLEVYIPITSAFEKSHHQKTQLHNLLKVEFATRYLTSIHVDPTQANIARFMKRMPRYVSFIRKGSGDDRYLVLKLLGGHNASSNGATGNAAYQGAGEFQADRGPMSATTHSEVNSEVHSVASRDIQRKRKNKHLSRHEEQEKNEYRQKMMFNDLRAAIMSPGGASSGMGSGSAKYDHKGNNALDSSPGSALVAGFSPGTPMGMRNPFSSQSSTTSTHFNSTSSLNKNKGDSSNIIPQIEPFESYSKRFLYPFNVVSQLKANKTATGADQSSELENDFSRSIYQIVHNFPVHVKRHSKNTSSPAQQAGDATVLGSTSKNTTTTRKMSPNQSHRITGASQSHASLLTSHSSNSSFKPSTIGVSKDIISSSTKTYTHEEGLLPKDHLSYEPPEELRKRFETLFQDENNDRSDMEIILDKELEKPPTYIQRSEIKSLQAQFIQNFPFHMWEKKLPDEEVDIIKKIISSLKLTDFIKKLCIFSYWTFLGDFGLQQYEVEKLETQFLKVYEEVLYLVNQNKQKQARQVVELPIILLCIRVCTETIYQTCYPNFWPTVFGKNLAKRMEILITFLLDPQYYVSNLAPMQSSIGARKLEKQFTKQQTILNKQMQNKQNLVSPLVKFILQDPRSLGARKLLSNDVDFAMSHSVVSQLFEKSDNMRSKLITIMMSTKIKKGELARVHRPKKRQGTKLPSLFD